MITIEEPAQSSVYKEDISTLAAGTEIVGQPCVIYKLMVTQEQDGNAIVSFSNTIDSYDVDSRILKIVVDGPATIPVTFPKGLKLSSGLCATSNLASVDVFVSYD